ncbi:MAG: hypothetical protein A2527_05065 [Candidatus Lambdaproteobacteria bacterium RIFOXYD2_FULL_50_16]|uniref:YdhG-like domain-containing protein n=1 Tax=Candidatus Lambdaproteobacteria bacterium RIFOXYD2_FULL_50_16 TaxID=1817772 RepID=A0A1F6G9T9_9PROT|nr:MAG: hypothetical protein A2527_05065 [Candidatus Lambdaproteobacteria bacterium RIFOXYD2_FULL_50_16]
MTEKRHYKTFDEYVLDQPKASQEALAQLRAIILEVIPEAEELINYNIPAFALTKGAKREHQIMIAGYKKHVGLYPHPTTIEHFQDQLRPYKNAKGSVQFPLHEPLPKELIQRMIQYRMQRITA